jgi:WD40 repeat protein
MAKKSGEQKSQKPTEIVTNVSGGIEFNSDRTDITGDVIGRDKNVSITITDAQQYDVHGLANPYLGLQSFTYADHTKYAGREKLITETVTRLTTPDDPLALLFVTGASGSGKSSFVQAGVLPALEIHYDALQVKHAVFRPSRDPLAALSDVMWRQLGLPTFDAHAASPANFGNFLQAHTPTQQVNVIVIDQFEELFTQSAAQPRDAFFAVLTQLLPFRSTHTHIIATIRVDYLPELFALPTLYDIAKHGIDLRVMRVDELREAIQQPLRTVHPDSNKRFQSELVEWLAQDAAEDAAYLPLLQVTLEEIWRRGTLTVESYTNLTDAIKQRADKVLEYQDYDAAQPNQPRSSEEQAAILNLCLDLVDVSLDDEARRDVRRRRSKRELISGAPDRPQLIDTLTKARLLSVGTEDGEYAHVKVDLIHETLLSNWDRLRQAIVERRHELRERVRFEQQLKEWLGQKRSNDYLLNGVRLAEARELERRDDIALRSADAKDFTRLSAEREDARRQKEFSDARKLAQETEARRQAEEKRASDAERSARRLRRRNRIITAIGILALLVAIVAIFFGVNAYQQQRLSRSRELAAVALEQDNIRPERGLLIAIEAAQAADTFESQDALRQIILVSPPLRVLRGHEDQVYSAVFSPDGKYIVTASKDQTARVWDTTTGEEVLVLRGLKGLVSGAQFSPDGKYIVTASLDPQVWDAATGKEVAVLHGHTNWVLSAAFSRDGKQIVTTSLDGTARVWNAMAGKEVAVLTGHTDKIDSAQFSPDGMHIVTASWDGTARVWDATTGQEVLALRGHESNVNSAVYSPDGKQIVTASWDGTARVWDATTGQEVLALRGHESLVSSAAFSPDGKYIVTAGADKTVRVWDAVTSREVLVLRGHEDVVNNAAFSPDGKYIVSDSDDYTARVWDAATRQEVAVLRGHEDVVSSAAFSPDGKHVVTASYDGTARVWDAAASTSQEVATLRGHENYVMSAAFSPDGKYIVTASWDGTARVWDATTSQAVAVLRGHEKNVNTATFSPDGKQIVTASYDGTARVWDTRTGQEVLVLRGHEGTVASAAFSSDEKYVITASYDGTARVWNATTSQEVLVLRGYENFVNSAAFSPDGKYVVTAGSSGIARVWDARTSQEVMALRGHELGINSVAFSPDGKYVVTASADKTARVWDARTGQEVLVLRGHDDRVWKAAFSLDGKYVVTAGADNTARVWDVTTGQEVAVLRGHQDDVRGAAFSPDGKYIVTASADGTARIYLVHIEDLIALAKTRVTRGLTCNERVQYLHEDVICATSTSAVTPTP